MEPGAKVVHVICGSCKKGYKPHVFTACPHCGEPVLQKYQVIQQPEHTRSKTKRRKTKRG